MSGNLFGWSDGAWLLLDQFGALFGNALLLVTYAGIVIGFFKRDRIRRWLTRNRFPDAGTDEIAGMTWDGIVFTVSHGDTPRWVMQQMQPGSVAFIASEQSRETAEKLREAARGLAIEAGLSVRVVDADDPTEARRAAAAFLAEMRGMGRHKLAVDITGGKTPMSLGAFMAAEEAGAASLYVASRFDEGLRKPDMRTARVRVISRPD